MVKCKNKNRKGKQQAKQIVKPVKQDAQSYRSDSSMTEDNDFDDSEDEGHDGYRPGGYHPVKVGQVYNKRYKVIAKLGWGHFSTVWLCLDQHKGGHVAMKVQKSAEHYTEAAQDEIELLREIESKVVKPEWLANIPARWAHLVENGDNCVVKLKEHFFHKGPHGQHVCMIFETMGPNVLGLIKKYDFQGVPVDTVRRLAVDVLLGLDYLHRVCGIIHTDLKPENVLVCCPDGHPVDRNGCSLLTKEAIEAATLPEEPPKPLTKSQRKRAKKKAANKAKREAEEGEAEENANKEEAPVENAVEAPEPEKAPEEEKPAPKALPSPPYMRPYLKPSRSDPTLLSTYGDDIPLFKMPYHHYRPHAVPEPPPREETQIAKEVINGESGMKLVDDIYNYLGVRFKVVDLGNGCWIKKQFTDEIQTRQYRSPEVILQAGYDETADMWSFACMLFELLTGDYLFDPKNNPERGYQKEEDHLALCMELLGPIPKKLLSRGKHRNTYFRKNGELRNIKKLKYWALPDVLQEKYNWSPVDAYNFSDFVLPMLALDPHDRVSAAKSLEHPWLMGQVSEKAKLAAEKVCADPSSDVSDSCDSSDDSSFT